MFMVAHCGLAASGSWSLQSSIPMKNRFIVLREDVWFETNKDG